MDKDTTIKFYELMKKAQPKRALGLQGVSETDKELQQLQNVVVELINIIENKLT